MHFLRHGGVLDHRPLRGQVAPQNGDGALAADGVVVGTDDVPLGQPGLFQQGPALVIIPTYAQFIKVFAHGFAGDGHGVQVEDVPKLFHNGGHASGIVHIFRRPPARRANVQDIAGVLVDALEVVRVQSYAKFVGDGGQVQDGVGGAGYGGVNHDGVFKALLGDDIPGGDPGTGQLRRLAPGPVGHVPQFPAGGGQQGAARKGQPQRLAHYLHGARRAHKAARPAGGTGVVLVIGELLPADLPTLALGAVRPDLLQGEQAGPRLHHAPGDHHRAQVGAADPHKHPGQALVAAGDEHARVEGGGVVVQLHHAGDHVPAGQGVVDAVVSLGLAVADVGDEIPGGLGPGLVRAPAGQLHQLQQMGAAGVAVSKGALHQNLGLFQILQPPAHAQAQRVHLRRLRPHGFTSIHMQSPPYYPTCNVRRLMSEKSIATQTTKVKPRKFFWACPQNSWRIFVNTVNKPGTKRGHPVP